MAIESTSRNSSEAAEAALGCEVCRGIGWVAVHPGTSLALVTSGVTIRPPVRRCDCWAQRVADQRLLEIPRKFRTADKANFLPRNERQREAWSLMFSFRESSHSFGICGPYGSGKTHLLVSEFRERVMAGVRCHLRTTDDLIMELTRAEIEDGYVSPVLSAANAAREFHLFWDDIDKLKPTEFRNDALFSLIDTMYRRELSLSFTANCTLADLMNTERLPPALIRRLDDMCKIVSLE